jgi:signal transduction histidine kinase
MDDAIEKIGFYVIGGICGLASGFLVLSFDIPYFDPNDDYFFLVITILAGILISSIILIRKKELLFIASKKAHDETVALITHEMRTGLTETGWAIEAIKENYKDVLKEEDEKMLTGVIKSINTTVMHSVNLLDTSLMDIGKLVISLKWVKLAEVDEMFGEVLSRYKMAAEREGVTLTSTIKLDHSKQAEVDMLRLRVTLENLLENSIQYTHGADRKIDVNIHNDGNALHLIVKDNGIGIPETEQKNIFSEFFRATNARKKISTGSGIGLSTCYRYVKAHRGTIRFDSQENAGTTFYISLPLKSAANVDDFLNKI